MYAKIFLSLLLITTLFCELLTAQVPVNYRRTVPTGAFRLPALWFPFEPSNRIPLIGPGGSNDRAIFDLGFNLFNTYTITDVNGINDQLIVEHDSVRLEITDYQTSSFGDGDEASIVVGLSTGEVGILTLDTATGGSLQSNNTRLGIEGTGSIIVDSADLDWNNYGIMSIGSGGNGNLLVRAGDVSCSASAFIAIGQGSQSAATVTGSDASLELRSGLSVGYAGEGSLSVENGGTLTTHSTSIAHFGQTIGMANVDGEDSRWTVDSNILIGDGGIGELTISNGGQFNAEASSIGSGVESTGTMIVEGIESYGYAYSPINVGENGNGTLLISDEGRTGSGTNVIVGRNPGSEGEVRVSSGGELFAYRSHVIGRQGNGFLAVSHGGSAFTQVGNAYIARFPGSTGFVDVWGADSDTNERSKWEIEDLFVGGNDGPDFESGGAATLRVDLSGVVIASGETHLFPGGKIQIFRSGTLTTDSVHFHFGGDFELWPHGRLHTFAFHGSLESNGILAPGNITESQPTGSTTIFGNYAEEEQARLEIEIGGSSVSTEYDFLQVNGNAFLRGELKLELIDGYVPTSDQTMTIANVGGAVTGFFANVGDNQRLETVDGLGSFLVRYGVTSPNPNRIVLSDFQFNTVVIAPSSLEITRGQYFSGKERHLVESDDGDLSIRRSNSDIQSRTEFVVKATSPIESPTNFEFTLEGNVIARSNVVQTIELFDFASGIWEEVDSRNAARVPSPDIVVSASPAGDLSRFVEPGTLCIEARIRYQSDNPRQRFASATDQAIWTIY